MSQAPVAATPAEILRVELIVADLHRSNAFYVEALGFTPFASEEEPGERRLFLGRQQIMLLEAQPGAAPYPRPRAANDPWFQHFCIAVSDMAAAYAILSRHPHEPISRGGPQLLPPSTGSVTAYKFRDPDGHPLELSHIPGSAWVRGEGRPFRGIDHTALAVADLEASVRFYEHLGFQTAGRFLNTGPEQDRLDGLGGVRLDIVSLTSAAGGPHIELLAYRSPATKHAFPPNVDDIAATGTVIVTGEEHGLGRGPLRDPDGHVLKVEA